MHNVRTHSLLFALPILMAMTALLGFMAARGQESPNGTLSATASAPFESTQYILPLEPAPSPEPELREYLEVLDGCGPYFGGACVNLRSGPGTEYPAVAKLRTGVVLRVVEKLEGEGRTWYKVAFDEWVRYPDRLASSMYVAADYVRLFEHQGAQELGEGEAYEGNKRILVDRSDQMLYAYEGDTLFMEEKISTGLDSLPTPRGQFTIFRKMPSRYMQGPVPGITEDEYDLPGVPWTMYFTHQGGAIHGAYWHDNFGSQWSHGCVNLPPDKARELYEWAPLGTPVTVRD